MLSVKHNRESSMAKGPEGKKRPRDPNQLAKLVIDLATGEADEPSQEKDPAAVQRGREGGKRGGRVRASRMTPKERSEAAKKAARARWAKR
jgi:hypothetical protein